MTTQSFPPRAPTLIACSVLLALLFLLVGCNSATTASAPSLQGRLTIDGSTALQPLVAAAAQSFMQQHPGVVISVADPQTADPSKIGSKNGLKDVNAGAVDIGDSDIYADPSVYSNPKLTDHVVCIIPFAIIINPDVTGITSLSREQLIAIFAENTLRNWDQIGGPNLPIKRIIRPPSSGTRATFREFVLGGRDESVAGYNDTLLKKDSSQTVRDEVAATPGAIGYTSLSVLINYSKVTQVAIDKVNLSPQTIANGTYPFWGFEHMYTLGDTSPLLVAFLNFMYSPTVQAMAQNLGYYPILEGT